MGYGYNNNNSNNNYQPRKKSYNSNRPAKKRSGAKFGSSAKTEHVTGWNASKSRGFLALSAFPMTDKQLKGLAKAKGIAIKDYGFITVSKSNREYERWAYKIQNKTTGEFHQGVAFFNRSEMKLYIPRFGMVASCRKNYFGTSRKPKN